MTPDVLETQGVLERVHGGGGGLRPAWARSATAAREQEHLEEKRRIAQAAAALVRSGQRIFLDASTTAQVARPIKDREQASSSSPTASTPPSS
ncbi:MAG: hypothetical protein U0768_13200 [Anaerolineae bacterium]